ncbi:MAG: PadR family transcriptional regulator [Clostridia bacterium]|nr:PadR family transcriptional regulator [Clostridia bacterium]
MIQTNDIEENLKRGILEMLILKMLSQEDMYGYQMISEMNIRGKGLIDIKEGSLYGPLYRLIGKNYISENKVLVGKRRTRVYYHIEPLGVEYLNTMIEVYSQITEAVNLIMNYSGEGETNEENNQ